MNKLNGAVVLRSGPMKMAEDKACAEGNWEMGDGRWDLGKGATPPCEWHLAQIESRASQGHYCFDWWSNRFAEVCFPRIDDEFA